MVDTLSMYTDVVKNGSPLTREDAYQLCQEARSEVGPDKLVFL